MNFFYSRLHSYYKA